MESYNFITDLDNVKDSWRLKVRILRLWKSTFTLDMILMDERSEMIQATVKQILCPVFEHLLEEGIVVLLGSFGVAENKGKYPAWKQGTYKINFYRSTSVKRSLSFDGPMNVFNFFPFGNVLNNQHDPDLSIDLIGSVVDCGNMEIYEKKDKTEGKKMHLKLEDLDGIKVDCTLWDDFASQFHEYVGGKNFQHVVIILQFGRIRNWRGTPVFQNALFSSKLWIDYDIPEINDFKRRIGEAFSSQGGSQLSSIKVNSVREYFLNNDNVKKIDEILDSSEPVVCVVLATIKSIEQKHGWYYIACRDHYTKVVTKSAFKSMEGKDPGYEGSLDDGSLYCFKCKGKAGSVFPSYKVQVRVQDSTGSTSFVLFDREVFKLVHKQAIDIREKHETEGDDDRFPDEFNYLVDKRLLFKVEVSKYNIDTCYQVYTVMKLCDDPTIINEFITMHSDYDRDQDDAQQPPTGYGKSGRSDDSISCFDAKDVVSGTGDSSMVSEDDSPSVKRSREVVEKDVVHYSSTKKKAVQVKIEKL